MSRCAAQVQSFSRAVQSSHIEQEEPIMLRALAASAIPRAPAGIPNPVVTNLPEILFIGSFRRWMARPVIMVRYPVSKSRNKHHQHMNREEQHRQEVQTARRLLAHRSHSKNADAKARSLLR
jgi:hypothetical protein